MNDVREITGPRPIAQDRRLPKIAILGAGPAGLGAALRLARDGLADAEVIEARDRVGGNAGSFVLEGVHCDFGSHRLHPKLEPRVMADIEAALGPDLLWRPRHGRIRLQGRWIHFPLKPADLLLHLPFSFVGLAGARSCPQGLAPQKARGGDLRKRARTGTGIDDEPVLLLPLCTQALGPRA